MHVDDFEYAGQRYKSISRIAMVITGTNRNGWTFFGMHFFSERSPKHLNRQSMQSMYQIDW